MSILSPEGFDSLADEFEKRGMYGVEAEFAVAQLCRAVADLQRKAGYAEPPTIQTEMHIEVERKQLAALRETVENLEKRRIA